MGKPPIYENRNGRITVRGPLVLLAFFPLLVYVIWVLGFALCSAAAVLLFSPFIALGRWARRVWERA